MTTQTWHADRDLLAAYVAGALDPINGASVEQHLDRCAECRLAIRPLVEPAALDRTWAGIRDAVESPPLPLPARVARRLGVSDPTSILLGATASLRTAWVASAFVALGFAAAAVVVVGRQRPRPVPAGRTAGPGDRRRVGLRPARGPDGVAGGDDAVRPHPADPAAHPRRARLGAPVRDPARLRPTRSVVAGDRVAGTGAHARPGDDGAVQLRRSARRCCGRRHGVERRGALSVRHFPATWPVESTQQVTYLALAGVSLLVLFVRSRQDRQIGAVL